MTPPQASMTPADPAPPTTSSPKITTVGSRSISCASASLIACMNVIVRAIPGSSVGNVDVCRQLTQLGLRRRLRFGDGVVDELRDVGVDRVQLVLGEDPGARHAAAERVEAVAPGAETLHLARRAVRLRVALEVPVVTV